MNISVILCTYNPNYKLLIQCLKHINEAHKVKNIKELIIIDNNSSLPITKSEINILNLEINLKTKIILEPKLGLTYARLKGIQIANGNLLIFIDDDNLINENYFKNSEQIFLKFPFIGAFNGQVELKFDQDPPPWTTKYFGLLARNRFEGNHWSNVPFTTLPNGAGLCIHKEVGNYYLGLHNSGKRDFTFDRMGTNLLSGGDHDLAMCACDIGLGIGVFDSLYLEHIIPSSRLTLEYMEKLVYGINLSGILLKNIRKNPQVAKSSIRKVYETIQSYFLTKYEKRLFDSAARAEVDANAILRSWSST